LSYTRPYFQELAGTFSDKANFCQIDVDDNEDLVMELNVSGTPSFQAFFNGERKEQVANGTKESLKALVDKVVKL
jgi:thioredoxin-like negative regulator of GroEL